MLRHATATRKGIWSFCPVQDWSQRCVGLHRLRHRESSCSHRMAPSALERGPWLWPLVLPAAGLPQLSLGRAVPGSVAPALVLVRKWANTDLGPKPCPAKSYRKWGFLLGCIMHVNMYTPNPCPPGL